MAQRFLTNVDLSQNQILNASFEVVGTDPTTGNFEGRLIYNSTEDTIKVYSGSAWRKMLHAVSSTTTALVSSESNGTISLSIADVINGGASGLMTGADKTKLDNATSSDTANTLALRDASGRLRVSSPSNDLDAANKGYVDAARSGLDVKQSVRLTSNAVLPAYTYATNVITASADGALTLDGIELNGPDVGIRVLIKDEISSNAAYNGIYTVTASGGESDPFVLTRATDADQNDEVSPGMFVFVEQGTIWADSGWVLTTDGAVTLGVTNLTFVQFSSAGQSIAGNGLTKDGNVINVVGTTNRIAVSADAVDISTNYVGQSSITTLGTITTGTWNGVDIAVADGGTSASTASGARTNLADTTAGYSTITPVLARVSAQTLTGASTTFNIDHNFGTRDVSVQVFDLATYDTVQTDVVRSTVNRVQVTFSVAPGSASYRVVVTG